MPPTATATFGACKLEKVTDLVESRVTCPYVDFPPGREAQATILWTVQLDSSLPANFTQRTVTASWSVGGIADDGSSNGEAGLRVIFCGPAAVDPGCKNAQ
jgi:hypothetical protein